jgi:hypothetical protein
MLKSTYWFNKKRGLIMLKLYVHNCIMAILPAPFLLKGPAADATDAWQP